MSFQARLVSNLLGVVGAVLGGIVGYFAFTWAASHGFYAMIAPGGLLGIGCGLRARHPSRIRGIVCAVAGLGLGLFSEWKVFPFVADDTFLYLAKNIPQAVPHHRPDDRPRARSSATGAARKGTSAAGTGPASASPGIRRFELTVRNRESELVTPNPTRQRSAPGGRSPARRRGPGAGRAWPPCRSTTAR